MHGILLFAHGARDAAWARPFESIAAHMRTQHAGGPVALAYLELMQPGLPEAVDTLVSAGCQAITVVPMFLGAGGHMRRDLPALIEQLRSTHPAVQLHSTCAIGESDTVNRALATAALALATAMRAGPPAEPPAGPNIAP